MFELAAGLMDDTFGAIGNVWTGVTNTVGSTFSGFFPTPQTREPIRTEIAQPAISLGVPRVTYGDAPSLAETAEWARNNWMDSPYEAQFAPNLRAADPITTPWEKAIGNIWTGLGNTFVQVNERLPEILMRKIGIIPESQPVNSAGGWEIHTQTPAPSGINTTPAPAGQQPGGYFNLGFLPDWMKAPVVPIPKTDVSVSSGSLLMIAGILIVILMIRK